MKSENILKADLLDIVFDNRNKDYGAYELRRHYKRRMIKALGASFIIAAAMAGAVLLSKGKAKEVIEVADYVVKVFNEPQAAKPKAPEPKKPEAPKAPQAAKPVAQQKFVPNIQITKNEAEAEIVKELTDEVAIGTKNSDGQAYKGQVIVDKPINIDEGGDELPSAPAVDKETPRLTADVMPAYPGGMAALRKFLQKNLQSPNEMEEGELVSVKVKFIVGYDGKLKGFEVVEDGDDVYNKEVIRVLKKMPQWIPGKANGENVSVYYTIPVKFTVGN